MKMALVPAPEFKHDDIALALYVRIMQPLGCHFWNGVVERCVMGGSSHWPSSKTAWHLKGSRLSVRTWVRIHVELEENGRNTCRGVSRPRSEEDEECEYVKDQARGTAREPYTGRRSRLGLGAIPG